MQSNPDRHKETELQRLRKCKDGSYQRGRSVNFDRVVCSDVCEIIGCHACRFGQACKRCLAGSTAEIRETMKKGKKSHACPVRQAWHRLINSVAVPEHPAAYPKSTTILRDGVSCLNGFRKPLTLALSPQGRGEGTKIRGDKYRAVTPAIP